MKPIIVIGIGSPHGADQFGWQVIEFLQRDHALQTLNYSCVHLVACDRPGLSLLEYIKGSDMAIIVDAIEGGELGHIRCLVADQLMRDAQPLSSHYAGVAEAITLGAKLKLLPNKVIMCGMELGDNIEQNKMDSVKVRKMAKFLIARIEAGLLASCYFCY